MQIPDNSNFDFQPDDFEMVSYRDGKGNLITKEEYELLQKQEQTPAGEDGITDVAFTEVKREEAAAFFNPVVFLTNALASNGLSEAAASWMQGIDPRAQTAESEKDRIFFANRALRLFLAEVEDRENITPRMLLADGIDSVKWCALMEQGVIPWLLNQFDKKGKRIAPEVEADPVGYAETGSAEQQPTEQWDATGEMVTPRDELNTEQAVIVGVDAAAEGTSDQSVIATGVAAIDDSGKPQAEHMPVKWDVPILKSDRIPDTQEDGHFLQERSSSDDNGEEH